MYDFHTHTDYSDGANPAEEMLAAAKKKNLKIFAFSEHHPRPMNFRYQSDPVGEIRGLSRWTEYIAEIERLKKENSDSIEVLLASEFDWLGEKNISEWKKWRQEANWDFTIGSVHFLDECGIDYLPDWKNFLSKKNQTMTELFREYFAEIKNMVEFGSDYFEIVGHFDLIKKFVPRNELPKNILSLALPALKAIAKKKKILEINTAGWSKLCAEQYPSQEILQEAHHLGIRIILNSDAHHINDITRNFDDGKKVARQAGYTQQATMHTQKKIEMTDL